MGYSLAPFLPLRVMTCRPPATYFCRTILCIWVYR